MAHPQNVGSECLPHESRLECCDYLICWTVWFIFFANVCYIDAVDHSENGVKISERSLWCSQDSALLAAVLCHKSSSRTKKNHYTVQKEVGYDKLLFTARMTSFRAFFLWEQKYYPKLFDKLISIQCILYLLVPFVMEHRHFNWRLWCLLC